MILFSKRGFGITAVFFLYILFFTTISALVYETKEEFFVNILSGKFYEFQLIPMLLIMLAVIDKSISPNIIIRTKNRTHSMMFGIIQHYVFALILSCIYFTIIILVSIIKYKKIESIDISYILRALVLFTLNFILAADLTAIFRKINIKNFSSSAYVIVYLIIIVEISLIKKLNLYLPGKNIYLMFSWISSKTPFAYLALSIEIIILTIILFKVSAKADILN